MTGPPPLPLESRASPVEAEAASLARAVPAAPPRSTSTRTTLDTGSTSHLPAAGRPRAAASRASLVEARAARAATLAAHRLRPAGMRPPGVADGVDTEATADGLPHTPQVLGRPRAAESRASPVAVEAARVARADTLAPHPLHPAGMRPPGVGDMEAMEAMDMDMDIVIGPPLNGRLRAAESQASPAAAEAARGERAATLAAHPPAGALLITIGVLLLRGLPLNGPPQVLGPHPPAASLARAVEVERAARAATRLRPLAGALLMATTPG